MAPVNTNYFCTCGRENLKNTYLTPTPKIPNAVDFMKEFCQTLKKFHCHLSFSRTLKRKKISKILL